MARLGFNERITYSLDYYKPMDGVSYYSQVEGFTHESDLTEYLTNMDWRIAKHERLGNR